MREIFEVRKGQIRGYAFTIPCCIEFRKTYAIFLLHPSNKIKKFHIIGIEKQNKVALSLRSFNPLLFTFRVAEKSMII